MDAEGAEGSIKTKGTSPTLLDVVARCLPASDCPFARHNEPLPGTRQFTSSTGRQLLITPEPRLNTWTEHAIAVGILCSWFLPICLSPFLLLLLLYQAASLSAFAWTVIAGLVVAGLLPAGTEWKAYRQSQIWETWHRHFSVQYITPRLPYLQHDKQYMFAQWPHGAYPMCAWLSMTFAGRQGSGSSGDIKGSIASIFFSIPFVKHNYAWVGCIPADKASMLSTLKHHSLACLPEGIAGIFQGASPSREAVYLQNRKGFVRVAIQAGTDIVPMYTLGQSQLLTFKGSERLSRLCRASLGIWWGWCGLPIPRPHKLITIIGTPISVKQSDNPSRAQVDDIHAQVKDAISEMYHEHRSLLGWDDRPLHFI